MSRMNASWEPVAPPVWTWYRVYAGLMAAMYLAVMVAGVALTVLMPDIEGEPFPKFMGLIYAGIGAPLGIAYLAAFFIPRAPWAWIYHLVLICIGLSSICCMVASVPLLIFWLKPEAKQFFGRPA